MAKCPSCKTEFEINAKIEKNMITVVTTDADDEEWRSHQELCICPKCGIVFKEL